MSRLTIVQHQFSGLNCQTRLTIYYIMVRFIKFFWLVKCSKNVLDKPSGTCTKYYEAATRDSRTLIVHVLNDYVSQHCLIVKIRGGQVILSVHRPVAVLK